MAGNENGKGLTDREKEVLSLISEGRTAKEVANKLFVSKRTVDFHVARIYEKLDVCNRVQALRRASACGILCL